MLILVIADTVYDSEGPSSHLSYCMRACDTFLNWHFVSSGSFRFSSGLLSDGFSFVRPVFFDIFNGFRLYVADFMICNYLPNRGPPDWCILNTGLDSVGRILNPRSVLFLISGKRLANFAVASESVLFHQPT